MNNTTYGNIVNTNYAFVQTLAQQWPAMYKVEADVLRLDVIHPVISGNKWFKLKFFLQQATAANIKTLLTFGGAYSNHIAATAYAAAQQGNHSIGIIRGGRPPVLSHTLQQATQQGMQLFFVSRHVYTTKHLINIAAYCQPENTIVIPEGGASTTGAQGAAEILQLVNKQQYTHILCAVGTGTTLAGIVTAALPQQKVTGISVLKGEGNLQTEIAAMLPVNHSGNFEIIKDYHFGGYAKKNNELINFMNTWFSSTQIPTDFVYTAKMFFAFVQLLQKNYFEPGSKVLLIHTGGLQGNCSLPAESLLF
jgi:1-aminocyclopropane-1-carboxylate deaminase